MPSLLFTDTLRDKLEYVVKTLKQRNFILYVHPFVDAYLKKGLFSMAGKWKRELGGKFKVMPDQSLAYLQYRILDSNRQEIDLREEKELDAPTSKSKARRKAANVE